MENIPELSLLLLPICSSGYVVSLLFLCFSQLFIHFISARSKGALWHVQTLKRLVSFTSMLSDQSLTYMPWQSVVPEEFI